jgi:hypothetical protein
VEDAISSQIAGMFCDKAALNPQAEVLIYHVAYSLPKFS